MKQVAEQFQALPGRLRDAINCPELCTMQVFVESRAVHWREAVYLVVTTEEQGGSDGSGSITGVWPSVFRLFVVITRDGGLQLST